MIRLIIPLLIIFSSCDQPMKQEVQQTNTPENFEQFFKKFKNDTVFQKTRLSKPVLLQVIDEESNDETFVTTKLNTVTVSFNQKDWKDKITVPIKKISKDSVVVELKGVETGLWIEHYFINEKGLWYLNKIKDLSD